MGSWREVRMAAWSALRVGIRRGEIQAYAPWSSLMSPAHKSFLRTLRDDYERHERRFTNPAFVALATYRFGRWALAISNPLARRAAMRAYGGINVVVANLTKVWIPPQVSVGEDFHIVHAEGSLSIHPNVVIGDRFGVMHNVTIGTNAGRGVPKIGDDVFIGVNSTVLGKVKIGDRVRIGANTAVTTDVPSDSVVVGSPARIFPRLGPFVRTPSLARVDSTPTQTKP